MFEGREGGDRGEEGDTYASAAGVSAAGRSDVAVGIGAASCVLRDAERRIGCRCGHAARYFIFPQSSAYMIIAGKS